MLVDVGCGARDEPADGVVGFDGPSVAARAVEDAFDGPDCVDCDPESVDCTVRPELVIAFSARCSLIFAST